MMAKKKAESTGTRTRANHDWWVKFVETYREAAEKGQTADDVAEKLGVKKTRVLSAASQARKMGVELPSLKQNRVSKIDWAAL
jgi:L-cysteine desulfidase